MSWPCRLIKEPSIADWDKIRPGDMWFISRTSGADQLAPEHATRRQLVVCLPGPTHFAVYGPTWTKDGAGPHGWNVVGDPPNLTITPSINCSGVYHGYITNGVITDDCEGRKFNDQGRRTQG